MLSASPGLVVRVGTSRSFSQRRQAKWFWLIVAARRRAGITWLFGVPRCGGTSPNTFCFFFFFNVLRWKKKNRSIGTIALQHDYSSLIIACWVHRCRETQNIPPNRENNHKHADATLFIATTASSPKRHIGLSNQYKCGEKKIGA